MKTVLSIAASDSGGGAGIQGDIKTISALGAFPVTALTALTAQNTTGVSSVYPVSADFVTEQIETVLSDIGADAVKTGMLCNKEIVQAVSGCLKKNGPKPLVVDTVMTSKSGATLLDRDAVSALTTGLFPLAEIVTPNLDEAAALCAKEIGSVVSMKEAAKILHGFGSNHVLVKGGHLEGRAIDIFYDGSGFTEFASERINTSHTHGTGCCLSAALATFLALGYPVIDAVATAKEFVTAAIKCSRPLGKGWGPVNPFADVLKDARGYACIKSLKTALNKLESAQAAWLIPEVQSNLGAALYPDAGSIEDIVAFPGRLVRLHDKIKAVSEPEPGASRHIAKIILTAMKHDKRCRSAMNIRYSPEIIDLCRNAGFTVGEFSRKDEPADIKAIEGSTLEWGTDQVISGLKKVPDIIFDTGDTGKEPMARVMGTDPVDVALKVIKISAMRTS